MEGDSERSGVDRGRGLEGLFRVGGSCGTAIACGPKNSRRPGAAPDRGDAQARKLWQSAAVSDGARDSARRGGFPLAQQHTTDAVRSGDEAQGISAYEV